MDKLKGPMLLFDILLVFTTLTCALVTGFILTFAVVVTPDLASLGDRDFIRAFQVTDGVIQRGQPVFSSIWIGSVIATVGLLIASIADTGRGMTSNRQFARMWQTGKEVRARDYPWPRRLTFMMNVGGSIAA